MRARQLGAGVAVGLFAGGISVAVANTVGEVLNSYHQPSIQQYDDAITHCFDSPEPSYRPSDTTEPVSFSTASVNSGNPNSASAVFDCKELNDLTTSAAERSSSDLQTAKIISVLVSVAIFMGGVELEYALYDRKLQREEYDEELEILNVENARLRTEATQIRRDYFGRQRIDSEESAQRVVQTLDAIRARLQRPNQTDK